MATTATLAMAGPSRPYNTMATSRPWLEDQTTPLFVGVAVTACTVVGAGIGATLGMGRDNPFKTSASMGARWMVASSVFFGCREYLVTPLMTHYEVTKTHSKMNRQLSLKQLGKLREPSLDPELEYTRWETRTQRVIDSAISGGIVGGGTLWIIGGPSRIIRGGLTGLCAAAVLQFSANSLRMARADVFDPPIPKTTAPDQPPLTDPKQTSVTSGSDADLTESRWSRFSHRSIDSFKRWFPIKKLSTEEQLDRWLVRKDALERRLKAIEVEELKLYEKVQALQLEREDGEKAV